MTEKEANTLMEDLDKEGLEIVKRLKNASVDEKVDFFKKTLADEETLLGAVVTTNIFLLVTGGLAEDTVFERDDIIFSSLVDYLDVKHLLRKEIDNFSAEVSKYFIGALKGYYVGVDDFKKPIPNLYFGILNLVNLQQMSKFLSKADFNIKDIDNYMPSVSIVEMICSKNLLLKTFQGLLNGGIGC